MIKNSAQRRGERGATLVEYVLVVVALAGLFALVGTFLGSGTSKQLCKVNEKGLDSRDDIQSDTENDVQWNDDLKRCCKKTDSSCRTNDGGFPSGNGGSS